MKERDFQAKKTTANTAEKGSHDQQKTESTNELTAQDRTALVNSIIANTPIVLWAADSEGNLIFCEGKGLESLAVEPHDFVDKSLLDVQNAVPFADEFQRALRGECVCVTKKIKIAAENVAFENRLGPLCAADGKIIGVAGAVIDVSRRQKIEEELRADQLLMERLIDSHERDRRLTAYEIHDGLVQDATGANMHLETLLQNDSELSEQSRATLKLCRELVRKIIIEARHLISGLKPPILDELGLVPAIQHLVDNHNKGGQNILFKAEPTANRMTPLVEGSVFRIAQEAIANAVRHSRSDRIQVELQQKDGRLELEVLDFGAGFDPANIEDTRFGIQGMRERARLLDGHLEIDSAPGRGARVFLKMPITTVPEVVRRQ